MLENFSFDAPISFIYHRDVYGVTRKTFAFAPVSKNAEGKFDKYIIVSIKKLGRDNNNKEIARAYVLSKLAKFYRIYAAMEEAVRGSDGVKASFAKQGVAIISHPQLKKMRMDAAKNNVAAEKIAVLKNDLIVEMYSHREYKY